mmetsp:Transcript_15968/g.43026  ORF Transcript_15968/g.43026 Transcript_15968/m.43026 type:complete len:208 (-) Transcript_15968:710-1333(-)
MPTGKRLLSLSSAVGSTPPPSMASWSSSLPAGNMALTAAVACSTPVEARLGGPSTSPAPYTRGLAVQRRLSTSRLPRPSTDAPTASRLRCAVLASLPAASMYRHASRTSASCWPFCVMRTLRGAASEAGTTKELASTSALKSISMLDAARLASTSPAKPPSMPKRSRHESRRSPRTRSVTCESSAAKILANSMAMMPEPVMMTDLGM